jgi:hypothetical protein
MQDRMMEEMKADAKAIRVALDDYAERGPRPMHVDVGEIDRRRARNKRARQSRKRNR